MIKKTKSAKTVKRRTKVKDLPKSKQELTGKDLKKIKGGGFKGWDIKQNKAG